MPSDTMTSGMSTQRCCAHSLAHVQLRGDIDKLKSALAHRTAQTQAAERAHTVSAAIFAMTNALTRGASLGPALDALKATAPEDEVVAAVVKSLPEATKGGSSRLGALLQRFAVKVLALERLCNFVELENRLEDVVSLPPQRSVLILTFDTVMLTFD